MKPLAVIILVALSSNVATARADKWGAANDSVSGGLPQFLQTQSISGAVRTNYFHSSKRLDNDTDFPGATAQIKVLPELTGTIDGKLEARITTPSPGNGGDTHGRLLEGYVTAHFEKADLRIGKQIVAWGRADGINPTDNLTPRDYVVLLPFDDDQRFGTTALKLDTYLSPEHTLTVFTTPFFEPSKVALPVGSIKARPERTLSNSELGFKLNKVGGDSDWSVSVFRGLSLLPDARVVGRSAVGPKLEFHYDHIRVLGADFARNYGRFGVRGELAYVDTADDAGTDPGIKNPSLFWIAGVDRTFFDNLNINVQFFQRRVRRYHTPENMTDPTERAVAMQNAMVGGQQDQISNGISFRVGTKWFNDTLEAEIFAVVNVTRHDRFIRPLLTYAFSDHWKGTLGAELYRGAAQTQFGNLKSNQGTFAELRYGF